MVTLWFVHGTDTTMMIEVLKMVGKVLTDKNHKVRGQTVRANIELSPQRIPMGKAQARFYKAFSEAKGDKDKNLVRLV